MTRKLHPARLAALVPLLLLFGGCARSIHLVAKPDPGLCPTPATTLRPDAAPRTLPPGEYELTAIRPTTGARSDTVQGRLTLDRAQADSALGRFQAEGRAAEPALLRSSTLLVGCVAGISCDDAGPTEYRIQGQGGGIAWGRWRYEYNGYAVPMDRRGRIIRSISGPFCLRRLTE